jgi:glycosyltransferase involved in cell wall biosynthesis
MESPLVSIVIPAYNAARFLPDTLRSLQNQTYKNIEVIVVNDGSTDDTTAVCLENRKELNLRVIEQANGGVSRARNAGLADVNGEFIALLDADDFLLPQSILKKVNLLIANPELAFVYSEVTYVDENLENPRPGPVALSKDLLHHLLLWDMETIPCPCSNLVFRSSCLTNKDVMFEPALSTIADKYFCAQLSRNFIGGLISEPLFLYRVVSGSMSRNVRVMEKDSLNLYRLYRESGFFSSKKLEKQAFSNMYLILGASWIKDAKNYGRGFKFIIKAWFMYPANFITTMKKVID